jgi:hypothetical protein
VAKMGGAGTVANGGGVPPPAGPKRSGAVCVAQEPKSQWAQASGGRGEGVGAWAAWWWLISCRGLGPKENKFLISLKMKPNLF